jgi:hypothetical protein
LQPLIERTRQGEQNVFWETPIKWFAKSSGTTNAKSKFIPVSNEALEDCHYKGSKDLLCLYLNNNENSELLPARVYAWEEARRFMKTTILFGICPLF